MYYTILSVMVYMLIRITDFMIQKYKNKLLNTPWWYKKCFAIYYAYDIIYILYGLITLLLNYDLYMIYKFGKYFSYLCFVYVSTIYC